MPWLLATNILDASAVVTSGLTVEDRSRRNRNFLVRRRDGTGYLVKQAKSFSDPGLVMSLRNEGDFLRALTYDDILEPFAARAPRLIHYDPGQCLLVTELVHPATSVTKYHLNRGKVAFPREGAASAARLLADFHEAGGRALKAGRLPFAKTGLPIPLAIFEYLEGKVRMGDATARAFLARVADAPAGPRSPRLKRLVSEWVTYAELVHGDARWDNFLLTHGTSGRSDLNLKLIDWELVSRGDPALDVATWLGEYHRFQSASAIGKGVYVASDVSEKAAFQIGDGAASARGFVDAYFRRRRVTGSARAAFLRRVAEYLPHYLAQAAWEQTMSYLHNGKDGHISPWSLHLLDQADHAARDPAAAMKSWYGLEVVA